MLTPLFSAAAMEPQRGERELQLLLLPATTPLDAAFHGVAAARPPPAIPSDHHPHLDLSLSISIGPPPAPASEAASEQSIIKKKEAAAAADVQALRRQTAEQARMASAERAYAERVMELARRELELAEREFARARAIWERARGEVEKVERVKAMAARRIAAAGSAAAALEITCHACMQSFHPAA
ncbi:unnamed protein product [Urochloa decumbens]|uniref:Uncharacterized protein n=1 Tax=Urochloa decumbens TaxID=240449 RepID=A0ABC8VC11_9POAL